MTFEDEAEQVTKRIRDFTAFQLRAEFPYMKTSSLEKLLDDSVTHLQNGLVQQQSEMQTTKARSSFMSLSAELRNTIYEMALCKEVCDGNKNIVFDYYPLLTGPPLSASLLCVDRQIHKEASSILYGANTFECNITLPWSLVNVRHTHKLPGALAKGTSQMLKWLQGIGHHAKLVKCVLVHIGIRFDLRQLLGEVLRTAHSLKNTELSVHQTVLKLCGLLDLGVAAEVFKVKAVVNSDVWGVSHVPDEPQDLYQAAGVDGGELFTEELLARLPKQRALTDN